MEIFYLGAEQQIWRDLLLNNGVDKLGISFNNLMRRWPKKKVLTLEDRYPTGRIFLDSGGFAANKNPGTQAELEEYAEKYLSFLGDNLDRIEFFTEFDSLSLGPDWIRKQRSRYEALGDPDKLAVVWYPQFGVNNLFELATHYRRIGVPESALTAESNLAPRLNLVERQYGVKLHAIATTKPDTLKAIHFATAASTSWLSPSQFGDTIVWDGMRLRRYPKKYKERARERHKMLFEREGFDVDKIMGDDSRELLRLSVWSWTKVEESMNHGLLSDNSDFEHSGDNAEIDPTDVGNRLPETRKIPSAEPAKKREGRTLLPVIGLTQNDKDQQETTSNRESIRQCNTCYVASTCPAFKADFECAFGIPVEIRSQQQLEAFLATIVEIQGQRVLFGRYTEELQGGYPDPNVSAEFKLLLEVLEKVQRIKDSRDTLRVNIEAKASSGMLSRIFGDGKEQKQIENIQHPILDMEASNELLAEVIDGETFD